MDNRTVVMGILNVTPDSFSDGGRYVDVEQATRQGIFMAGEGADIIDIGGESSRPGAQPVSSEEELDRILPVVSRLSREMNKLISIDTVKAEVARRALEAGAHIINDISGMTRDRAMVDVVNEYTAGLVIMHMQGNPQTMQESPLYDDVVTEVSDFLCHRMDEAVKAGLNPDQIVVDPGIGFGKSLEHNLDLLRNVDVIGKKTGRPVLIGVSRKRFIGTITGREVNERLAGSLAAITYAIGRGARIIRVHDVKDSCDIARMIDTLKST
jgi:dihydropteroate synthase